MIRVEREELLRHLEAAEPGLSRKQIIDQSECFVFKDGKILTYNGEVFCRVKSPLGDRFEGAVSAWRLLDVLRKMPEKELVLSNGDGQLLIKGKNRKSGVRMQKEVLLPVDKLEVPKKWQKLAPEFLAALALVRECASKDQSDFAFTCVHFHPKWLEACDNHQMARYRLVTGVRESVLVRKDSAKNIVDMDVTEMAETESWLWFRNPLGFVVACRRWVEQYKELTPFLKVRGEPVTLPQGLRDAADKAHVFSQENADDDQVLVEIRPGKVRVRGEGQSGWYAEVKKIRYKGPPVEFLVSPKMLMEIAKEHSDKNCEVGNHKIRVESGRFVYMACLSVVEDKEVKPSEE